MYKSYPALRVVLVTALVGMLISAVLGQGCPGQDTTPSGQAGSAPVVQIVDPGVVHAGEAVTLQGQAFGGTGGYTYEWEAEAPSSAIGGDLDSPQITFTPPASGSYRFSLFVTDANGRRGTDTLKIVVYEELTVSIEAGESTDLGIGIQLKAIPQGGDGNYSFSWSPADLLDGAGTLKPTFTPTATGIYEFEVAVNDNGGQGMEAKATTSVVVAGDTRLVSLNWDSDYSGGGYEMTAHFSRSLQRDTAENVENYRISGTDTNPVSATLAADQETVTLHFESPLAITSRFDISLDAGLVDTEGNVVAEVPNRSVAFNRADTTLPEVQDLTWEVDQIDSYKFTVTYSEAVDRTTAETKSAYRLQTEEQPFATSVVLDDDGRTVTVEFAEMALSDSTEFSIGVTNPVKDINGNETAKAEDLEVQANSTDINPPRVVANSIIYDADYDGSADISEMAGGGFLYTFMDGYRVFLEFNEVMSKEDVENTSAWYADDPLYTPSQVDLQSDGRSVELYFVTYPTLFGSAVVPMATDSRLNIGINNLITDMNGNAMDTLLDEVIQPNPDDDTRPTIESVTWAYDFGGDGYEVVVTFSEVIDFPSGNQRRHYKLASSPYASVERGTPDSVEFSPSSDEGRRVLLYFFEQTYNGFYNDEYEGEMLFGNDNIDLGLANTIMDINGNTLREVLGRDIASHPSDSSRESGPYLVTMQWQADQKQYIADLVFNESMNIESSMFNPETYLVTQKAAEDPEEENYPYDIDLKLDDQGRFDGHSITLYFQGKIFTALPGEDGEDADELIISDLTLDDDGFVEKGVRDINLNAYPNSIREAEETLLIYLSQNPNDITPPQIVGVTSSYDFIEGQTVISIEFSEVMDAVSVNENSIFIWPTEQEDPENPEPLEVGDVFLLPGGLTANVTLELEEDQNLDYVEVNMMLMDINGVSIEPTEVDID